MIRKPLHRLRWKLVRPPVLALSGLASRGGPDRIRRLGRALGELHYRAAWPFTRRLRRDIARALGVSRARAGEILHRAFRDNDRAVFEVIALAHTDCDAGALIDNVSIAEIDRLARVDSAGTGAILLGMHMGNGILMAAGLARAGYPVHVVFREPRRLPPGLLVKSLERAGCVPVAMDRQNPTRNFRRMLRILAAGGMLYVLMDQANKGEGEPRRLLGKILRMPTGIPSLAVRTGAPVIPVHCEAAGSGWSFRVHDRLVADSVDQALDAVVASMQSQIVRHPELWTWHHRRWRRYHFAS